jgi:hypothetical protein
MTKRVVHHLKAARPVHHLKAADLGISAPELGGEPPSIDNLEAASLVTGAPEFTAPALTQLRTASAGEIKTQIDAAFDAARAAEEKPPNSRQLAYAVQARLRPIGLFASKAQIERLGKKSRHRMLRRGEQWARRPV